MAEQNLTSKDRQFIAELVLAAANQLVWTLGTAEQFGPWTGTHGMYQALKEQLMEIANG